ncbi:MAG TPA: CHAT domain-containing protein, partial [Acidobacteriota bacterium]|nr:CHAT domain-containing protein [Acidobacteriota bacterium]
PAWQTSEGSYTKYAHLAEQLYRELVAPAEQNLKHVQRLIIAPDGILNYLPFESLLRKSAPASGIDFSSLPYLTNDFEIEYAPSSTVFAALKIHEGAMEAPNELLAFADPGKPAAEPARGKTRSSRGDYPPLPNARLEVEGIARLFPPEKVAIFEGQAASEEKLKKMKLTEYKRLHFASHGVIDEQNPEFSSILLSTPQKGAEDGYLMTQEIFDLKLNADLVVLSACKTGLGRQIRGEGIMGLSRAFLCAGASSVLASLWNVPDASTAQFMTDFYRSMVTKGMSKTEALKKARLELIRSGKFSHPYYWAPFVLIGN